MANFLGTRTRNAVLSNGSADNFVRNVDTMLDIMSWETVPFLKLIGINGTPSDALKIEWMLDDLLPETVTISAATLTTANTTLTVVTPDGAALQIGSVLKFRNLEDTSDEYMRVSAVASVTSATVERGIWGSTNAWIATSAVGTIVGIAMDEGSDTPMKGGTVPTFNYNYHQIFETGFKITQRAKTVKQYGVASDEAYQLEKAMKEIMIKLEYAAIFGKRYDGVSGDGPMGMGGLDEFMTENATDLDGEPLEEKDLLDALQTMYYDVGADNMGKTVLCGAWAKRKVASWYDPRFQMKTGETTGGVLIDSVRTDFGTLDLVMLNRIPTNAIYIINKKNISVCPLKGGKFAQYERPAAGQYSVNAIYGDYSMKVKNPRSHAKLYDFSTSL